MLNQTFLNIASDRWTRIQAAFAQKAGVTLAGDSGSAQDKGIHFSWAYSGDALAVTVLSVPWYLPVSEQDVMNQFATWINSVL